VRGTSWTFVVQAARADVDGDVGDGALILALTLFASAGLTLVLVVLLRQRSRRLAREHLAAHERASAVLSLVDDGYLFLRGGEVVDLNERFCRVAGVDAEVLRRSGARHPAIAPFAAVATEVDVPRGVQVQRPDGTTVDVLVTVREAPDGRDGAVLLIRDVTPQKREERRLTRLASTDGLTGLQNRGAFDAGLERLVAEARESELPLSLVIVDVDHFKSINDRFGHPVGDRVLIEVARRLKDAARDEDLVGRVGGEEFAWVLPGVDGATARTLAERARRAVVARPFPEVGTLGLSAGVCCCEDHDARELYVCADDALLHAKRSGRDRTVCGERCRHAFSAAR
jgi:diguanylate cyclase (GGDEF)-like protein/PAS domain S-box-containing protein